MERSPATKLGAGLWACLLAAAACQCSSQPLTPCEKLGTTVDAALLKLGGADTVAGVEQLTRAIDEAQAQGCPIQEARIHSGLGWLDNRAGRLPESLHRYDAGVKVLAEASFGQEEKATAGELQATLEHNRGASLLHLGLLDVALGRLELAQTLRKLYGGNGQKWANLLLQLARVHRLQDRPADAAEAIQEALSLKSQPSTRAALWMERAGLDAEAGRLDDSERALDEAWREVSGADPRARANVIADRAGLELRRQRWAPALELASEALELAEISDTRDLNLQGHANYLRSVALLRLGQLGEAKQAADRGLSRLFSVRDSWSVLSLQYFAWRQKYFRHRLDIAIAARDAAGAWAVIEGNQARNLAAGAGSGAGELDATIEETFADEIARRRFDLLEALERLDLVEPDASEEVRAYLDAVFRDRYMRKLQIDQQIAESQRRAGSPVTPERASELLGEETLALTYAAGSEQLYVLVLGTRHGLELPASAVDLAAVEVAAASLVTALDSRRSSKTDELDAAISELSRHLLEPIADRLAESRRLVIVADGPLARLPFELLRHPGTDQPLIESHEIAYLPSLSVLAVLRERAATCPRPPAELLAAGDPVFGHQDERWPEGVDDLRTDNESLALERLEATAEEVSNVARLYSRSTVLLGSQATRERVLEAAPKHRVIQLASHARSDSEDAERSKIFLSCLGPDGPVMGACDLYLQDVAALRLCGQLVVLSACRTADGRSVFGEGILGLPRAFLLAGASMVVASHWQVSDDSTARLMESFHRHLRGGQRPAAALRRAKIELIASGASPRQWAPFVVLGDG